MSGIINYDLANNTEDYTFITRSGNDIWKTMWVMELMQKTVPSVPEEIYEMVMKQAAKMEMMMKEKEQLNEVENMIG